MLKNKKMHDTQGVDLNDKTIINLEVRSHTAENVILSKHSQKCLFQTFRLLVVAFPSKFFTSVNVSKYEFQ